ncbi:carbohydrate ABC transporter permease [Ruania alkalisoli]|uniref:Carbohydrate ABC transporter permease n=1 Tax=Ruania alkalisoli TaxID=2779775 RepID=A0A7M1SW88_9MICO|nr:carbohydrate ABC transporter permease [Ruania alkalisoli]QOR70893.1 carbohydrate ABC transporter permease [Ruania alkalisoli]
MTDLATATGVRAGGAPHRVRSTPSGGRARRPMSIGRIALILGLIVSIVYFFLPFWWLGVASTKSTGDLYTSPSLWFADGFAFFENIARTFAYQNGIFFTWIWNTILYSVTSAVGATVLATMGGYAFAKYRFRGRKVSFAILLGAVMIPNTVLVLPTYMIMSNLGLVNTIWAVILPGLLNPLGVYLVRIYGQDAVPDEVLESARIDGAKEFRIFTQIALPMLRPAIATVLLFSLVNTWNNFFLPLVMISDNRLYPLTVGLNNWRALATIDGSAGQDLYPLLIMGSLLAVVPLIIAFLAMQRQWQSGLALGAVK